MLALVNKANLYSYVYIRIINEVHELCDGFEIYQQQSKGLIGMNLELSVQTTRTLDARYVLLTLEHSHSTNNL